MFAIVTRGSMTSRDVTWMMTSLGHMMTSLGHFPMPLGQNFGIEFEVREVEVEVAKLKLRCHSDKFLCHSDIFQYRFGQKFGNEPESTKFRADSDFTRHYY